MKCRVCSSDVSKLMIDLGDQPWGNHFLTRSEIGSEPFYPLQVVQCSKCKTAQLNHTVRKEIMFGDHSYLSGITNTLVSHFHNVASEVHELAKHYGLSKSILDIGSNDGAQLACYEKLGFDVLGVESSKSIAKLANSRGIKTLHEFFNLETAAKLDAKFSFINASGVFFHLEELHSVCQGIKVALRHDGVFVVQFIYLKNMVENGAFDQIYHEHLLYYNLQSLSYLLGIHDLQIFDAYPSSIHGGSIIAYICHSSKYAKTSRLNSLEKEEQKSGCNDEKYLKNFADQIKYIRKKNLTYFDKWRSNNKKIFGMGAPVKGNTLLNYFGITKKDISCLLEKNELRKNLYAPGSHIPILLENEVNELPDVFYVLAWNFKKEILKNHSKAIEKGVEFFFPVET